MPVPGSQIGRYAAEPATGLTSLTEFDSGRTQYNASVQRAVDVGDGVKRIDGTEVPLRMPWQGQPETPEQPAEPGEEPQPGAGIPADETGVTVQEAPAVSMGVPDPVATVEAKQPQALDAPRGGAADDLKQIWGIGPKLAALCHKLGFFHFDQIAAWTAEEIAWVDAHLEGFKGRVSRDRWVAQARHLIAGGSVAEAEKIGRGEG